MSDLEDLKKYYELQSGVIWTPQNYNIIKQRIDSFIQNFNWETMKTQSEVSSYWLYLNWLLMKFRNEILKR